MYMYMYVIPFLCYLTVILQYKCWYVNLPNQFSDTVLLLVCFPEELYLYGPNHW